MKNFVELMLSDLPKDNLDIEPLYGLTTIFLKVVNYNFDSYISKLSRYWVYSTINYTIDPCNTLTPKKTSVTNAMTGYLRKLWEALYWNHNHCQNLRSTQGWPLTSFQK